MSNFLNKVFFYFTYFAMWNPSYLIDGNLLLVIECGVKISRSGGNWEVRMTI